MTIRAILALATWSAALGASAQGYLGSTERVEFVYGGSVIPNIGLFFGETHDQEIAGGYFHCVSPQTELGLIAGTALLNMPLNSSSSDETIDLKGLMVRAEMRYYLRSMSHGVAPMGYYIRPAFQYQSLGSEYEMKVDANPASEPDSLVTRSFEVEGSTMILGFGFGRQVFFGEHVSLDWVLTTGLPISLTIDDTIDEKAVSKELFRTQIFGVRFGLGYQF